VRIFNWISGATVATLAIGAVIGIVAVLAADQMDHYTNTDKFCTSCHLTGDLIAKSETFMTSTHRTRSSGVRPLCSDCHIPKGLIAATWTHVVKGVQDLYGDLRYDYTDPAVWKERRPELAYAVRDWMLANDSVTCRSCHDQDAIKPEKKRGQVQHAEARESGMTCIACHYNLVHEEVEPRDSFLEKSAQGNKAAQ
jgi:nitrate/TMAO reductase-like tetraheme cytochrome c subunit